MRVPTPNSMPPFCHQVNVCTTGVTTALAVPPPSRAEHAATERRAPRRAPGGVFHPVDPLDDRDAESTNDAPSGDDADLRALARHALPEEAGSATNETAGIARDDPGVFEHVASALQLVDLVEIGTVRGCGR